MSDNLQQQAKPLNAPITKRYRSEEQVVPPVTEPIPEPTPIVPSIDDVAPTAKDDKKDDILDEITKEIDPQNEEDDEEKVERERIEALRLSASHRPSVNLGTEKDILKTLEKKLDEVKTYPKEQADKIRSDPNSELNTIIDAYSRGDHQTDDVVKHVNSDLSKALSLAIKLSTENDGLRNKEADLSKKFKDGENVVLDGKRALAVFAALSGTIKKIDLPNSGISVSLRAIPLDILARYYNTIQHDSWEYGREFGEFYYSYSHLQIIKTFIEILFPAAVFGSTYMNWKSRDSFLKAITYHDFNVIVWAMTSQLYPEGAEINFYCPKCGASVVELCDINELKKSDIGLLSQPIIDRITSSTSVTDDDLVKYREALNLKKVITHVIKTPGLTTEWKVTLKQANMYDYLKLGESFMKSLLENSVPTDASRVADYMFYDRLKQYMPWIDSITCVRTNDRGTVTYSVSNNGTEECTRAIDGVLASYRSVWPEFGDEVDNYILSTKITHIAYYKPTCPKCGAETNNVKGFIPFDCLSYFFTLCFQKLITDRYQTELKHGSKD